MKKIIFAMLLTLPVISFAQKSADTLYYLNEKFYIGKEIQLNSGSSPDKSFVFVQAGTGSGSLAKAPATWTKTTWKIDKIYGTRRKQQVRAQSVSPDPVFANKLFIDLEAAIDNKEIKVLARNN